MIAADIAVIGLGAAGSAALYQLARRGIAAIGIDRFDPPHAAGSSHGETRITRQAVGEGAEYVPLVLRSHQIWRELEAATGERLLETCGGVIMGLSSTQARHHDAENFVRATAAVAERFAIEHEVLDRAQMAARFPQFVGLQPDDIAYFEPGAGFVFPEACIRAQLGEAQRLGATVMRNTRVIGIVERGDAVHIETDAGQVRADQAIVCAGAWTGALLGPPYDNLLRVTRQQMHWFGADDPSLYEAGAFPVFIWIHGHGPDDFFYGFPTPAGSVGVKVACEQHAILADPDAAAPSVEDTEAAAFHAKHIAGRLAGVHLPRLRSETCLYTEAPGSRFLIDTHPRMPSVLVVSACSGHGFKHSASIGELAAEYVQNARRL